MPWEAYKLTSGEAKILHVLSPLNWDRMTDVDSINTLELWTKGVPIVVILRSIPLGLGWGIIVIAKNASPFFDAIPGCYFVLSKFDTISITYVSL
jgi:hypothetical protein